MKSKDLYRLLAHTLEKKLSPPRFEHSVNVGKLAAKLGKIYGWNPERARLAGLLHDCVKEWSPRQLKNYVRKYRVQIPAQDLIEKTAPNMLHAYVGADVVRRAQWITHKADLKAIASHTLGSVDMSVEDKILYIADFAANGRKYHSAKRIRRQAMDNLDKAFREALLMKIWWQLKKTKVIHPLPVAVWNRVVCRYKS